MTFLLVFAFSGTFADVLADVGASKGASQQATLDEADRFDNGSVQIFCLNDTLQTLSKAKRSLFESNVPGGGKRVVPCNAFKARFAKLGRFALLRSYPTLCNNSLTAQALSTPIFLILSNLRD